MRLDRDDRNVAGLTMLSVAVLVTTYTGWDVPLIGDSHRWAAAVIVALGVAAGALGAPLGPRSDLEAGLVVVAFLCAVLAFATGSLTAVALLMLVIVALVATAATRHLRLRRRSPIAT